MKHLKQWVALFCALALVLTLSPAALAEETPTVSNNISGGGLSCLYANDQGGLTRVLSASSGIAVEDYNSAYQMTAKRIIPVELSMLGGFFHGSQYNFLIFGQGNPQESDSVEVIRVVKYSQDWQRLGQASIKGVNVETPFYAGSVRCTEASGELYIHTARRMYSSQKDGLNHQANISFKVQQSDMSWELLGGCYVSHSFDQFILVDQEYNIVRVDLGDGYPRAVTLSKYENRADPDLAKRTGKALATNIQEIPGPIGRNYTGVNMIGVAETSGNYVTAYIRGTGTGANNFTGVQDIFLAYTSKNDLTTKLINVTGAYTSANVKHRVGMPTLASTGLEGGYIMWNTHTGTDNKRNNLDETLYYAAYSADGTIGPVKTGTAPLAKCEPVLYNGRLVWYAAYNSSPVFYGLDQNGVQKLDASSGVSTAPLKDSRGAPPPDSTYTSDPKLTDPGELRCAGCGYLMRKDGDTKNIDLNNGGASSSFFYYCTKCYSFAYCHQCAAKPGTEAAYLRHENACQG